ncbi:FAD dependent oxidoreductase [Multifurca ochricompacta]|uniref:FAD dependent oxidoreductase n=1 Tax=Multifurca ochricompacta TaxID=376703 RepID=A0AAD4M524_9AGAM|nr:FAD dependent oxidoreductase [Multifurca ochricompacta]
MVVSCKHESVIVVGAGCFGISTAYHLLQRGFTDVTVIDRSETLPAPDAASTDINKVVRTSYSDIFYTRLARDAIEEWKKTEEWGDTYRESGVLVSGSSDERPYASKAYINDLTLGVRTVKLDSGDAARAVFPANVKTGISFERSLGYLNLDSGWALAAQGVEKLMARVITLGGKVVSGMAVVGLMREDGRTSGVRLADGSSISARLVVIASGSWTASTFPELNLGESCLSTGQTIAHIKLTEVEAAPYRNVPVVLDFQSNFYVFPPNDDNIIKFGLHNSGVVHYTHGGTEKKIVSTPRTVSSHGDDGLRVPQSSLKRLRSSLRDVYPDLADKAFTSTRLCWYTDSPDGDWVIGYYPSDTGLFLATSGSGHAYKFLPVIGRIIADAIEGTLDPVIAQKFATDRKHLTFDQSRGLLRPLDLATEQLCLPEDLLP